jgi:hypothetical protein
MITAAARVRRAFMSDLRQALAEINAIRTQVARDTQFRGYGPVSIAASGVLAFAVAALQSRFSPDGSDFSAFLQVWIATAAASVLMTAVETVMRSRRVHSDLANEMLYAAAEQFVPAVVVSILLTVVMMRNAPHEAWMLPGLWQLMFSLGVFASCRFLPRQMVAVAVWYLVCGLLSIILQSDHKAVSPWIMGIPFGVGQWGVAGVLTFCFDGASEDA